MSDFIFINNKINKKQCLNGFNLFSKNEPKISFYSGDNFSLAISENIYNGFLPFENDEYILVVVGGPILNFTSNSFISIGCNNQGTKAIFDRWESGEIKWCSDLDGSFVVLIYNKFNQSCIVVTDLMAFIPVYYFQNDNQLVISTHLSLINEILHTGIDKNSIVDLILHDTVVFPYTCFADIFQIYPASIHEWQLLSTIIEYSYKEYWSPLEVMDNEGLNLNDLTFRLQKALKRYISLILESNPRLGILMSGGEDSRTICGMLPESYPKDGFMFTSNENNVESQIAKKVSNIYNVNLSISLIKESDFENSYMSCSSLVGIGSDCAHVHSYSFYDSLNFHNYDVILGGFLSDTFLKSLWDDGHFDKKLDFDKYSTSVFDKKVLDIINLRRKEHFTLLKKMRPKSAEEWSRFWPCSMQRDVANIHGHRRLFRNFEPFTISEVVKVSALAPNYWKKNRVLFNRFAKPFLDKSKFVPHNNGFLPYFSYKFNKYLFISSLFRLTWKIFKSKNYSESWQTYDNVFKSPIIKEHYSIYFPSLVKSLGTLLLDESTINNLESKKLSDNQKRNLLQLAFQITALNIKKINEPE